MRYLFSLILPFAGFVLNSVAEETVVPYKWENVLTLENISNLHGGVSRGSRSLANLDITLTVDTNSAGWWDNGTWYVYVLGDYGKNPSELTGDMQGVSNIATAVNDLKLYEFWYQHQFAEGKIKWLFGLHDYNSTFNSLDSAGLFSSPSFGIEPDISQVSPSIFPVTSVGSVLQFQQDIFFVSLGVYDGVAGDPDHPHGTHIKFAKNDGLFKAFESGISKEKHYKLAVGAWQHTAQLENPVDGTSMDSNHGFYIIGENYFSENIAAFFQYGKAESRKNQIDQYEGAGVRVTDLWLKEDAIGLAYSRAHNGLDFLQHNPGFEAAEGIFEFTYFCPLIEHVNFQSSLYYIDNPGALAELDNATALGLRLYVEF